MSSADVNETGPVLGPSHIMQTTHMCPAVKELGESIVTWQKEVGAVSS